MSKLQQIPQFEAGRDENANNLGFMLLYPASQRGHVQEPPPGKPLPPVNNARIDKIHSKPPGQYGIGTTSLFSSNAAQEIFSHISGSGTAQCCILGCVTMVLYKLLCPNQDPGLNSSVNSATHKYNRNSSQFSGLNFDVTSVMAALSQLAGKGGHAAPQQQQHRTRAFVEDTGDESPSASSGSGSDSDGSSASSASGSSASS